MNQQQFDQAAYLRRIKYDGETEPAVDTLKALHHAQLYTIPFDIDCGNYFASTHPSSLFVFARVAALPVGNGVITLFNNTLKEMVAGKEIVQELPEGQAYLDALKSHFGIELDTPYEQLRSLPESD